MLICISGGRECNGCMFCMDEEKIVGKKAPDALMYDDAPEIPEEAIPEVHEAPVLEIPKEEKPVKKATTRKKTTK